MQSQRHSSISDVLIWPVNEKLNTLILKHYLNIYVNTTVNINLF